MKRSPVCPNTGRGVFSQYVSGPGPYWPVKSMMLTNRIWHCEACGRKAPTRIEGQRGRWVYRFTEHPRRGVTKAQWSEYQENGQRERSEVAS